MRRREALRHRVRQFVNGRLHIVRAPPLLEYRRLERLHGERREEEIPLLTAEPQMRVPCRDLHERPVFDRVERRVAPGGHPVADDGARPPVVHPAPPQFPENPVDSVLRHHFQPPRDKAPFGLPPLDVAGPHEQVPNDDRRIVVVDVQREDGRVHLPVIRQHVLVQEFEAEPLVAGIVVELPLPGRGDRRVDEHQHVLARDQLRERLAHRSGSHTEVPRPAPAP
ncbi:hypothetical protein [Actinomadura sp. 9N215]|uniref:hypothetical protein n=1 Tax=Actinomadura sp. 9N215 TaxID=3375150 RepID=UPI0037B3562E